MLPFEGARRELWDQMWAQPIAVLWAVVDVAALTRMVVLQTTASTFSDNKLLVELRQLEDRFLLNPYARAQQRVVIEDADQAEPVPGKGGRQLAGVSSLERARRRSGA